MSKFFWMIICMIMVLVCFSLLTYVGYEKDKYESLKRQTNSVSECPANTIVAEIPEVAVAASDTTESADSNDPDTDDIGSDTDADTGTDPDYDPNSDDTGSGYKYVCLDETVVDDPEQCKQPDINFEPVNTNEIGTVINKVEVVPGCVKGMPGGVVHFNVGTVPDRVSLQVKDDPNGEYVEIFSPTPQFDAYVDYVVYEGRKPWIGSFRLEKGKVYMIRLVFDFTTMYGNTQYSNEHIIDARRISEYTDMVCSYN